MTNPDDRDGRAAGAGAERGSRAGGRPEPAPAPGPRVGDPGEPSDVPELDPSALRTVPVSRRPNKVRASDFASPPAGDTSFRAFIESLPDILEARSFLAVADAMADAARGGRAVVCMLGGHVVKTGLAPVLIDLMERGAITHLASNGSAVIHDWEMTRWGGTSEDVAAGLADGTFGMAEETGREMNEAIAEGARRGWGMGEALGRALEARANAGPATEAARDGAVSGTDPDEPAGGRGDDPAPGTGARDRDSAADGRRAADAGLAHPDLSLLLAARRLGLGFTVHAALGCEIIHQHPAANGAAIGETSLADFRRLAAHLEALEGGVVLNLGSAVVMPEVFLKALTVCRNVNGGRPRAFVAADFDMIRHYRPRVNVVERPTETGGGVGYQITGHHEIMVPMLAWAVAEVLAA